MGKRKRRADPNKASASDVLPHSSQMDALPQQESSANVENSASTPIATILEIVDGSVKLQKISQLPVHQQRLSRTMFLRNPSLYARKYSRRNTGSHADASTSHAKDVPLHVENEISKKANRSCSIDSERQTESLARPAIQNPEGARSNPLSTVGNAANQNPEGVWSSPLSTVAPSHNIEKICKICERPLKRKPQADGLSFSYVEPSVVAVLVCGHIFHADCLEERTCQEERTDPSCPSCRSLTAQQ